MPLPAIPREGGEWSRREHFGYVGTAPGKRWHAYIAGPGFFLFCHQPKKTKPCVAILTNRALECPWCTPDFPIVRRGYVPLYRQADNKPCCVIVSDLYEDAVEKFTLHDRVVIGKEDDDTDPVWITKAPEQRPAFQTTLRCRFDPVDLDDTLLKLWGHSALRAWYEEFKRRAPTPVEQLPEGAAIRPNGKAFSPALQAAAKRAGFDVLKAPGPDASEEESRAWLESLQAQQKPSRNGRAKTKPPPKG